MGSSLPFTVALKEKEMNDKKLYQQKKQAELDEWKAKVDVLRTNAKINSHFSLD